MITQKELDHIFSDLDPRPDEQAIRTIADAGDFALMAAGHDLRRTESPFRKVKLTNIDSFATRLAAMAFGVASHIETSGDPERAARLFFKIFTKARRVLSLKNKSWKSATEWPERVTNLQNALGRDPTLAELLAAANVHIMTPEEKQAQGESFARAMKPTGDPRMD